MKSYSSRSAKWGFVFFILALFFFCWAGENIGEAQVTEERMSFDVENAQIQTAVGVQNRHTPQIMAIPGVVGTATGLSEEERPAILVFTETKVPMGVFPKSLQSVPVIVKATGKIFAIKSPVSAQKRIDRAGNFPRPVPIGVSTGNEGDCSAGTISARVKDDKGNVYALSNNHVYALENDAPIGSRILQPGLFDTNCNLDPNDVIGTLSDFEAIDFSGAANVIDAAIALSSVNDLGNATPRGGYGIPKSNTTPAAIKQRVQKYGRTTGLTGGTIFALNATINVSYPGRTATFVNQIVVKGKSFLKAGDSGSLLVTYRGKRPVGLLFAGNSSGSFAFANPINDVLTHFNVTIDGK